MTLEQPGLDTVRADGAPDGGDGARPSDDPTDVGLVDPAAPSAPGRSGSNGTGDELAELGEASRTERAEAEAAKPPADRADGRPPRRKKKRRARKVRRIVRRLDAWSVLKFSLLFFFCVYLVAMVAGVLLWNAAQQAGTIEGFEGFIADLGAYETFEFEGDQIFNGALLGGLVLVLAASAGNVLLAVLFNLISDLMGGLRITVVEEETARPRPRRSLAEAPVEEGRSGSDPPSTMTTGTPLRR